RSLVQHKGLRVKVPKTKRCKRTIRISTVTVGVLREHRLRMDSEGHGSSLVFPGQRGSHVHKGNFHARGWSRYLQEAGIPRIRFHCLRHLCITTLLARGENVKAVSERAGHSSVGITLETYSHVLPAVDSSIVSTMDGVIRGILPTEPAYQRSDRVGLIGSV